MCGQRRQRRGVEETLFPVGTRAPTVATKLFIAFDGPSSTGPGPARSPANPSRPARCAPGRTALSDRRSVGRPGNGQRVSDPFGDGSSSLDYIYRVAGSTTSSDVCAADRYSSVFERRHSSKFSIVLSGRQQVSR